MNGDNMRCSLYIPRKTSEIHPNKFAQILSCAFNTPHAIPSYIELRNRSRIQLGEYSFSTTKDVLLL